MKSFEFQNVRENGKFIPTKNFSVAYFDRKDTEASRFGIVVSKKISTKATVRNKVKRQFKEIIKENITTATKRGIDFVIIVKPGILKTDNATIRNELEKIWKEL